MSGHSSLKPPLSSIRTKTIRKFHSHSRQQHLSKSKRYKFHEALGQFSVADKPAPGLAKRCARKSCVA